MERSPTFYLLHTKTRLGKVYYTKYEGSLCIFASSVDNRVGDTGLRPCPLPHYLVLAHNF